MSLHDFDSRAGLETMVLHFGHDSGSFSSHSLSPATALDGYIMVPGRVPLADKYHNAQNHPIPRLGSRPTKLAFGIAPDLSLAVSPSRPSTPAAHGIEFDVATNPSFTIISLSRPSTPFQPLPPVLAASPLRLPSFLDLTLQSLDDEPTAKPESPSPRPIQLSIEIPSVSHPNSPYVPWASPVRRNILRPLSQASHVSGFSGYSRPYSRSGARAPEPDSPLPTHTKFLRLSKSFKNLRRTVKEGVRHVKNAFNIKKVSKAKTPHVVDEPASCRSPIPPLPSPLESCESSNTTTLAEWLRECEANVERATPHLMTLEEYEERGSWKDRTSIRDESEIQSPLNSETEEEEEEISSEQFPSPAPMSPTCTNSSTFPQLSIHDIWPKPPCVDTPDRNFSAKKQREMSMPGGWASLRDSPASHV